MKKTTGKKIIFLGDSITEGVGASCREKCWASLVTAEGEFAEGCNFGVRGTRMAAQRGKDNECWAENFVQRLQRLPAETDYVLIFGGTNDYGHGDAPLGRLGDSTPDTFYGAVDSLLVGLMQKYPTAKIGLLTPIHRVDEQRYVNEFGVRNCGTLADYVAAEKEVCVKYAIPVLDLYTVSGICPSNKVNREIYAPDGLHPSDKGHRAIADKILQFIDNVL